MPKERIGSDFVARVIAAESSGDREGVLTPATSPRQARLRAWIGTTVDRLRDTWNSSAGPRD
jgi:hypothetical protein